MACSLRDDLVGGAKLRAGSFVFTRPLDPVITGSEWSFSMLRSGAGLNRGCFRRRSTLTARACKTAVPRSGLIRIFDGARSRPAPLAQHVLGQQVVLCF